MCGELATLVSAAHAIPPPPCNRQRHQSSPWPERTLFEFCAGRHSGVMKRCACHIRVCLRAEDHAICHTPCSCPCFMRLWILWLMNCLTSSERLVQFWIQLCWLLDKLEPGVPGIHFSKHERDISWINSNIVAVCWACCDMFCICWASKNSVKSR